ncbi:MAG: hypothetical protein Fur0024_3640 [Patescibacteria group bacterium]
MTEIKFENSQKSPTEFNSVEQAKNYLDSLAHEHGEKAQSIWSKALDKVVQAVKTAVQIVVKALTDNDLARLAKKTFNNVLKFLEISEIVGKEYLRESYAESRRQLMLKAKILFRKTEVSPIDFSSLANRGVAILAL